ncbi:MAG: cell division protein FtsQ/DivIB [Lachnospiraceae bacterium]|nr:cell division protein FtsQ/DivIB [Lachnospiraceae bacterium]
MKERLRKYLKPILIAASLLVLTAGGIFVYRHFTVKNVFVDGNTHYSDEQIADMILSETPGDSSIWLFFKYRNREIKDIPFIETMSVSIESPDTIRVKVYEKSLAGYVTYLGKYMYFDRDGVVVEASDRKIPGIPEITGLTFDHVVVYEKLPVENDSVFPEVLSMTQLLDKYSLKADKLSFDEDYNMDIYFGDVHVLLGGDSNINEKVMALTGILPKLEGQKGTLDLADYQDGNTVTFKSG